MLLNSLSQQFTFYIPKNFFYPEVKAQWEPVIKRMGLPYRTLEDFMSAQIKSVSFDNLSQQVKEQQGGQYKIRKRAGKPLDAIQNKELSVTFRLTESNLTYFILQQNFEIYLKLNDVKPLYWPHFVLDILSDEGFVMFRQVYQQLTPTSISNITLSYAAQISDQKEFTMMFSYNYVDRYRVVDNKLYLTDY